VAEWSKASELHEFTVSKLFFISLYAKSRPATATLNPHMWRRCAASGSPPKRVGSCAGFQKGTAPPIGRPTGAHGPGSAGTAIKRFARRQNALVNRLVNNTIISSVSTDAGRPGLPRAPPLSAARYL
jgi:hypothetical protein